MRTHSAFLRWLAHLALVCAALAVVVVDATAHPRGGSFGGVRGGSRGYSMPRSASPPSSFGGRRSTSVPRATPPPQSFGGYRSSSPQSSGRVGILPRAIGTPLSTPDNYRRSYGIPRRQETRTITTPEGQRNVIVHSYGGYGDGLLMGYLMGQTSWLWFTPFHPAFYYTQPYYAPGPNGTVEYYPPTFSLAKVLFVLVVIGALVFIAWVVIRNRRLQRGMRVAGELSRSSFGG